MMRLHLEKSTLRPGAVMTHYEFANLEGQGTLGYSSLERIVDRDYYLRHRPPYNVGDPTPEEEFYKVVIGPPPRPRWQDIKTAPSDRPVIIKLLSPLPTKNPDLTRWGGLEFVARRDPRSRWEMAIPIMLFSWPDNWIVGWKEVP